MFGTLRIVRWILFFIVCSAWCQDCREKGWEKIGGTRPEFIGSSTALFSAIDSTGIVVPCFDRCLRTNCTAFVIDFERSVCYSVEIASEELASEPNSTFYHQICVKVPPLCKDQRLWQVERTPGAVLIDSTSTELPLAIPRSQCYQECMRAGDGCKSAQFQTTKPLSTEDSVGRCSLSAVERGTRPQAYRASIYRDEYLQDQCHNVSKQDYCSFAEFRNVTLPYSEISLPGLDIEQCEQRCDLGVDRFICRSYTVVYSAEGPDCLLHSEDTTSLGVSSLLPAPNAIYKEREPCLDLKVRCDHSMLTVTLTTKEPFIGRIYASGYSDACGVDGTARNQTVLSIALPKREDLSTTKIDCGLVPAFSIDEFNRTHALVWATIVIQFNPIIQRLGDQAVRVGCSLDDQDVPQPRNVSVQSSFSFLDPNAGVPPIASTVVNISAESPVVTMRILDEEQKDAVVTQLGQKLVLRIDIKPNNTPYDITAGHLVASSASGDSSYLLLDEAGCPTDPATFPPLMKDPTDNRSLISTFTAFKFPDSQLVRFNVVVKFCMGECKPTKCRNGQISYGRRRRSSESSSAQGSVADVTQVSQQETPDELPLQLSIIVQSPVISADPLSSREATNPDTVLIAGGDSVDGLLCVDASLALSLLIFWLIIQIVLIVGCLLAVAQYRRMAIQAEEDRAEVLARHLYGIHGGNFEVSRRVRWADRDDPSLVG